MPALLLANIAGPDRPMRSGSPAGGEAAPAVLTTAAYPGADIRPDGNSADAARDVVNRVRAAVADGADMVDLGWASTATIAVVRSAEPDVMICADAPGADLTRDAAVAERTGAALLRTLSGPAVAAGPTKTARSIVAADPADVASLAAAGWRVLVDVDSAGLDPGGMEAGDVAAARAVAVAAVCVWLGASIVRTRHVGSIRQTIDMVESIRGTRAPFWTRRGLA